MSTQFAVGTRTQLSGASTALTSLANGTYAILGTFTFNTGKNASVLIEVYVKPGTVSGNKRLQLFLQESLDGSTFTTGPTSGTTTTDESVLIPLGDLPLPSNSTQQRLTFPYPRRFLPYAAKLIAKNDSGAALSSTGTDNDVYYSEISIT